MTIKKIIFTLVTFAVSSMVFAQQPPLEIVTALDIRPGNVAVSNDGRVFSTIHPLVGPKIQLIEITGKTTYVPFPDNKSQNSTGIPNDKKFDTPLGLLIDKDNVLWMIDMGLELGKTRLFAYDINTKKQVFNYEFPKEIAPKGSFIQDLALDKANGLVYLADIANPGIVVLNLNDKSVRRFSDASMQSENIDMIIDGNVINFGGEPARVAVDPITLSADKEFLYYGAMNGTTWYSVPTRFFRENADDNVISKAVSIVGPKPISDGAVTDVEGNHYYTNIQHGGIDVLTVEGELKPLIRDSKIDWADNLSIGPDGWLYMAVNQLHKTPAFTGGLDEGKPPYYILKTKYSVNKTKASSVDKIIHYSALDAMRNGVYSGNLTVSDIKQNGNFGIGTYNLLDGEMVVLDGVFYRIKTNGEVVEASETKKMPNLQTQKYRGEVGGFLLSRLSEYY